MDKVKIEEFMKKVLESEESMFLFIAADKVENESTGNVNLLLNGDIENMMSMVSAFLFSIVSDERIPQHKKLPYAMTVMSRIYWEMLKYNNIPEDILNEYMILLEQNNNALLAILQSSTVIPQQDLQPSNLILPESATQDNPIFAMDTDNKKIYRIN